MTVLNRPVHPDHARAREWRERMGLSRVELARRTGYSHSMIQNFELGFYRANGKPISDRTMHTYRMACAAVAAGYQFDWGDVTVTL